MATKPIEPFPKQRIALACPAFELLYGGDKGASKSFFLLMAPLKLLAKAQERFRETGVSQPKCRAVIFRKNLSDLSDLIVKSHEIYKAFDAGAEFNKVEKKWHFTSGATVEFSHLDGPEDHLGWNGQEIVFLGFDQVEQISFDVYVFLMAQVRATDPAYVPFTAVRSTANPGGYTWVKERFRDPFPEGYKIIEDKIKLPTGLEKIVTRCFIPARLSDNPILSADGQYEANLRATLPEHLIKRYLEGGWDIVDGSYFASMLHPDLHFVQSRPIPSSWDIRLGIDWGSTAPACCLWVAIDNDKNLWVIDELYMPGRTGRYFGEKMLAKVNHQKWSLDKKWEIDEFYGLIDHQATGNYGADAASPAAGIASYGFRIFIANKDRKSGIEQLRERLAVIDGVPRLRIFRDRCPNLVRELQSIRIDRSDADDYDHTGDGHSIDALRFVAMDIPVSENTADPMDVEVKKWERIMRSAKKRQVQAESDYEVSTGYDG
jgi:hypothetical protein